MADITHKIQGNTPRSQSLEPEQQVTFNTLLAQLRSRNFHNTLIIKKFIKKIDKKKTFLEEIVGKSKSFQSCCQTEKKIQPETDHELFQQFPKIQPDQQCLITKSDQSLKESTLFKTTDTNQDDPEIILPTHQKSSIFGKPKPPKYNLLTPAAKNQTRLDANFANYLKNVYVKELLEKAREKKQKNKIEVKKQAPPSQEQSKFINVKSLVFGSQDLACAANSQELPAKANRVSTEGNNGSESCINQPNKNENFMSQMQKYERGTAGYKLCNNFLPSISKHFGKIKKRDLVRLQSRLRMGEECSKNLGTDDYNYAISEIDSMQRIGISFRINTLQIKKHY